MSGIQFQYPEAFYLFGIVPILVIFYFFYLIKRRKALRKMGDQSLVRALMPDASFRRKTVKFSILLLVVVLGCVAIANPRRPGKNSFEARKGIDLVIALDVSNSMLAIDISPSRLARAKQLILRLVQSMPENRIALILFGGKAYIQSPLTFDHDLVRLYLADAGPGSVADAGTSIGDALDKCEFILAGEQDRFRSVVLLSDGETHDQGALEKAKELAQKGIMVNTIGIGSPDGATFTDSTGAQKKDEAGVTVISRLNEPLLKQIAETTSGRYIHLDQADSALEQLDDQFAHIDKKALGDLSLSNFQTFYAWLVTPMAILLVWEIFFSEKKRKRV